MDILTLSFYSPLITIQMDSLNQYCFAYNICISVLVLYVICVSENMHTAALVWLAPLHSQLLIKLNLIICRIFTALKSEVIVAHLVFVGHLER